MKALGYVVCLVSTLVLIAQPVISLSFEGIEEIFSCDKFPVDLNFDPSWMGAVPFWHIPIWNKVDYYQNAEDFFGSEEFSKLTEEDLERTCVYYKPNGTSVPIYGFDGKVLNYEAFPDPVRPGILYYTKNNTEGVRQYHATSYTTLSDNKSYFFAVTVWSNGLKGFNVGSTSPTLDEMTLNTVKNHAIDLGFQMEHFVENNYDMCPPPPLRA